MLCCPHTVRSPGQAERYFSHTSANHGVCLPFKCLRTPVAPPTWSSNADATSRGLTSQRLSSLVSEMSKFWCCSFSSSNRACQRFSSSCELFREVFSSLVWACNSSYSPFSWWCRKLTLGVESHRPRAEEPSLLCNLTQEGSLSGPRFFYV